MKWLKSRILRTRRSGNHLLLELATGERVEYRPGQYIILDIEYKGASYRRLFSIFSSNESKATITLVVSISGLLTKAFAENEPMNIVVCSKGMGFFQLQENIDANRVTFVSTGSGIVPYYSFLPIIEEILKKQKTQVEFIHGIRKHEDDFCIDEIAARLCPFNAQVSICISQESAEEGKSKELDMPNVTYRYGRITNDLTSFSFNNTSATKQMDYLYLCGNPNMIYEVESYVARRDLPIIVKKEKFVKQNYAKQ